MADAFGFADRIPDFDCVTAGDVSGLPTGGATARATLCLLTRFFSAATGVSLDESSAWRLDGCGMVPIRPAFRLVEFIEFIGILVQYTF